MEALAKFLGTVLPASGSYYVFSIPKGSQNPQQKEVKSIEQLVEEVGKRKSLNHDVYYGVGSFKPDTNRKKENADKLKVFFVDIDLEHNGTAHYSDIQAAGTALITWLKRTGFHTPTYLVATGHGLHAYWALKDAVPATRWEVVAKGFKQYLSDGDLHTDPSVTADRARILRAPGTINWKDADNPQACKLISDTGKTYSIEDFQSKIPVKLQPELSVVDATGLFEGASMDDLLSGREYEPKFFGEIVKECPTLRHELETQGKGTSYPTWWLTLQFLSFCDDGKEYIHKVSQQHAKYTPDTVNNKWESIKVEKEQGTVVAPAMCQTFDELQEGCGKCRTCPHWNDPERGVSWRSPMHFGKKPPTPDEPPWPYVRTKTGLGIKVKHEDGTKIEEVAAIDIQRLEVLQGEDAHGILLSVVHKNKVRRIAFDSSLLADRGAGNLGKELARAGHLLHQYELKSLGQLIVAWYKKVRDIKQPAPSLTQYGWVKQKGEHGFAVSDTIYWQNGTTKKTASPDKILAAYYVPHGTEERWRELAAWALEAQHVETEVIIASAFAAPLVKFAGVAGCMLSAVSKKSGTGKTLAMRIAQSVWGDPVKAAHSMNDTPNSVAVKMGITNNLPAYWDELRVRGKEGAAYLDWLFQLGQGRDKQRLHQTADLRTPNSWCTMIVCSSNQYLRDIISGVDKHTNAGAYRVLEVTVSPLDSGRMHNPMAFGDIVDHYGHIGPKYAAWLAANRETVAASMQALTEKLTTALNAKAEERFLIATIASLLLGSQYAKNLGFVDFNVTAIRDYLIEQYKLSVASILEESNSVESGSSSLGVVASFMADNDKNTCITNGWTKRHVKNMGIVRLPDQTPILVRVIKTPEEWNQRIILNKRAFNDWAYRRGSMPTSLMQSLTELGAYVKKDRIGMGLDETISGGNSIGTTITIPFNKDTEDLFGG